MPPSFWQAIRLSGLIAFTVVIFVACLPGPPSGWHFGVRTMQQVSGLPPLGAKTPIVASWIFDLSGMTIGSFTTFSTTTGTGGYGYCSNCRVAAKWAVTWLGPRCTSQWIDLDFDYQTIQTITCTNALFVPRSSDEYGEFVDYVPSEYWEIEFDAPPAPGSAGTMEASDTLEPDEYLESENGQYRLLYQQDGNLVIYAGGHSVVGNRRG